MLLGKLYARDVVITTDGKGIFAPLFHLTLSCASLCFDRAWMRMHKQLIREWSTFAEEKGVDPFGETTRVQLILSEAHKLVWAMQLYWDPEEVGCRGMHVQGTFFGPIFLGLDFVF